MALGEGLDNDTRGWIMTVLSGIACVLGASIICIDIPLRHIPGWKTFSIMESSSFLSSSMSLSFGVMIFSALYSILPSSLRYLLRADISPQKASWILLICFVSGFLGIQVISRFLHYYMPSHVVDCDHTHFETPTARSSRHASSAPTLHAHSDGHIHSHTEPHVHSHAGLSHSHSHSHSRRPSNTHRHTSHTGHDEHTPLLSGSNNGRIRGRSTSQRLPSEAPEPRRPSMAQVQSRVFSFVTDGKTNCDEAGPCFGYSEPCGRECFKHSVGTRANSLAKAPTFFRRGTGAQVSSALTEEVSLGDETPTEVGPPCCKSRHGSHTHSDQGEEVEHAHSHSNATTANGNDYECASDSDCGMEADLEAQKAHHHHVPENAFMSIGLQTSIAIALHKLPEGFITYATNHASPALGFSVFMALFIHNITEGFALALPLYLALGSRVKALLWASVLGGASQPLGAGIAAAWFAIQGRRAGEGDDAGPGMEVYGCMFAVTAGIMTSVALQLFVEGVQLSHRKEVCIGAAVAGMCLLAGSNALTA